MIKIQKDVWNVKNTMDFDKRKVFKEYTFSKYEYIVDIRNEFKKITIPKGARLCIKTDIGYLVAHIIIKRGFIATEVKNKKQLESIFIGELHTKCDQETDYRFINDIILYRDDVISIILSNNVNLNKTKIYIDAIKGNRKIKLTWGL